MSDLLGRIEQQDDAQSVFNTELLDCQKRCSIIDFMRASEGDYAFQTSALALLDWAPLIDDFKKNDAAIVRNSIHIRWINVRREFLKNLKAEEIISEMGWD